MNNEIQKQIQKFDALQWDRLLHWGDYPSGEYLYPMMETLGHLRTRVVQRVSSLTKHKQMKNVIASIDWDGNHNESYANMDKNSELFWRSSININHTSTSVNISRSAYNDLLPFYVTVEYQDENEATEKLIFDSSGQLRWEFSPYNSLDFVPMFIAVLDLPNVQKHGWHVTQGSEAKIGKYHSITENGSFQPNISILLRTIAESIPTNTPKGVMPTGQKYDKSEFSI